MKLVQFWRNGRPALGLQTERGVVDAAAEATRLGVTVPEDMAAAIALPAGELERLLTPLLQDPQCFTGAPLAPVVTGTDRIFCIGLNYRQHAKECGLPIPPAPVLFNKFSNALAAHGDCVKLIPDYKEYDYEAELVSVIGKPARNVSEEDALDYVFGYTCGGFAPVGPCLVPAGELDPNHLDISSTVNGEVRQSSNTSDMIFPLAQIIADLSHHFTLMPGDLIFTGTPQGVMHGYPADQKSWLKPGDWVEVTIQGIGTLRTTFC